LRKGAHSREEEDSEHSTEQVGKCGTSRENGSLSG
jgi:hypothetical protein